MTKRFYYVIGITVLVGIAAAVFAVSFVEAGHLGAPSCFSGNCNSAVGWYTTAGASNTGQVTVSQQMPPSASGLYCVSVTGWWASPTTGIQSQTYPSDPSTCNNVAAVVTKSFSFPGVGSGNNLYEGSVEVFWWNGLGWSNLGKLNSPTYSINIPSPPTLNSITASPSSFFLGSGTTITFGSWTNATHFIIQVSGSAPVDLFSTPPSQAIPASSFPAVGNYTIQAQACNAAGTCSTAVSTTVTVNALAPPTLVSMSVNPASVETNSPATLTFAGYSVDTTFFTFQYKLSTEAVFGPLTNVLLASAPGGSFNITAPGIAGIYDIKGAACNIAGCSVNQPVTQLTVTSPGISAPNLTFTPLQAAYITDQTVTINWAPMPAGADKFFLYVKGGVGALAGCEAPLGCSPLFSDITGKIGDGFSVGTGRYVEVKACNMTTFLCSPLSRITFDVSAPAGSIVYNILQSPNQYPPEGMGIADVWVGTAGFNTTTGDWKDSCPSGDFIALITGSLSPDTFGGFESGSGFSGLVTCFKYRAKATDPGIQEVAVVGDYNKPGLCPPGLALHSFGVGGLARGASIGTCVRYGAAGVITEVAQGGGGPGGSHPCFFSYAPTSAYVSSLLGNGMRTCVALASSAPFCPSKPASMPLVCDFNSIPPGTPDAGCQVSGYDGFPATYPDGGTLTYYDFPPPGRINREGGTCFNPPPLAHLAKLRFKVIDPSGKFIGGAQAYIQGSDIQIMPAELFRTSATEIEPGFNLVLGPIELGIVIFEVENVKFKAAGYYESAVQTISIVSGGVQNITYVLTPLPFDYSISAPEITVPRSNTISYENNGYVLASFKLASGVLPEVAQEVTASLSDLSAQNIKLLATYAFFFPPKCNPDCDMAVLISTNRDTPLGPHVATIYGTTATGINRQATFIINVTDSGNYDLNVIRQGTGTGMVASVPIGIACGVRCSAPFPMASIVTLTASEGPNSVFAGWSGCDSVSGLNGMRCTVAMNSPRSVTATFNTGARIINPPPGGWYRLTVGVIGSGRVVATNPVGIDCGENCAADFSSGTSVDLTAGPQGSNSIFQNWIGCDTPSGTSCRMIMNASKRVRAVFSVIDPPPAGYNRLTLGIEGNGYIYADNLPAGTIIYGPDVPGGRVTYPNPSPDNIIVCGTTCVADIKVGLIVNMSAFAGAFSLFQSWEGCDIPSGSNCSVTMNSSKTVVGIFNSGPPPVAPPYQYKLTINKVGSGIGTVASSPAGISCNEGCITTSADFITAATLDATPGASSNFTGWTGCDSAAGSSCAVATWLSGGPIISFGSEAVIPDPPVLLANPSSPTYSTDDVVRTSWNQTSGTTFFRLLLGGGIRDYAVCGVSPGCWATNTGSADRIGNIFSAGAGRFIEVRACNAVGCSAPSNRLTFDVFGTNTVGYERKVTASFISTVLPPPPTTYSLTVLKDGNGTISSPVGINCGIICSVASLTNGQLVTLTAAPDAGYSFAGWDGCDSSSGFDCTVTINNASRVVTARFSSIIAPPLGSYNLIVEKAGLGTGLVTSNPSGISCGPEAGCHASFTSGNVVILSVSPDSGSSWAGWNGCDVGGVDILTGSCRVTMTSSKTVTVIFSNIPPPPSGSYNLTVDKRGPGTVTGGGINCGVTCAVTLGSGTVVVLTAAPDPGASFVGWTDCDNPNNLTCTLTMNSTRTVGALFTAAGLPVPHWIEINSENMPE